MYTSHHDKFAVMFMHKGALDWSFVNNEIVVKKSEIKKHGYTPSLYLCKTLEEAQKVWLHTIKTHKDSLSVIKVSRMNRYNLEAESEVIAGTYREFK